MNMHDVRGWDMRLEVKMQLKVTHAPELTSDLIHTHCDLTAWRHTLKLRVYTTIYVREAASGKSLSQL